MFAIKSPSVIMSLFTYKLPELNDTSEPVVNMPPKNVFPSTAKSLRNELGPPIWACPYTCKFLFAINSPSAVMSELTVSAPPITPSPSRLIGPLIFNPLTAKVPAIKTSLLNVALSPKLDCPCTSNAPSNRFRPYVIKLLFNVVSPSTKRLLLNDTSLPTNKLRFIEISFMYVALR